MLLFLSPALAFGPLEALRYQSPEVATAQAALEAARSRAGLGSLGLTPSVEAARNDGTNSWSVGTAWQWNFSARNDLLLAVGRAERQVKQAGRDGAKNAQQAHAGLWLAQGRVASTQKRLEAAQARLEATEARLKLGAITASQREEVGLALKQAELGVRQAQNGLSAARAEATRYGLQGNAEAKTVRFVLLEVAPERSPSVQEAQAAASQAQARVDEANRSLLPQLNAGASYTGRDAQFQSGVSWTAQGPGANLSVGSSPSLPTNPATGGRIGESEWKLNIGARLTLPLEAIPGLSQVQAERDSANLRLNRTLEEVRLRLIQTRADAALALESLDISNQRLELARRQQTLVQARVGTGAASAIELLEAEAGALEAETAVAQAWQTYLTAVAAYLDLSDGEWRVEQ